MIPLKDDIPSQTFPFVTIAILTANIAVFIYQMTLGAQATELFIYRTAAIPLEVANFMDVSPRSIVPPPLTLFTAMFVHGGFFHIAGNMLFLWIFGDNVEDTFGHFGFFVFYIAAGLAASIFHIVTDPGSTMPMVGASGAIAGVLGAYFMLFPRAQIKTLVFLFFFVNVVKIPAVVFLGFWFLMQVLSSGLSAGGGGGIAWYAHIGGFIAGVAGVFLIRPKRRRQR